MLKKRCFYLILSVLFGLIMLSSCEINTSEVEVYNFTVEKNNWMYNRHEQRFEFTFNVPELTRDKNEFGNISGSVFVYDKDAYGTVYEGQKPLPYSQTFRDGNAVYTETISFDTSPGYITFYIQTSDLGTPVLNTYDFKITIIR